MNGIRRGSLQDLVSELERQKKNSKDIVVRSDAIEADVIDIGTWRDTEHYDAHQVVTLSIPEPECPNVRAHYPLTRYAHGQVAEKMGIPWKYYERMMNAGKLGLIADNINAWMNTKEKRLVRILDDKVRAVVSDRYRPIDNYDLVWKFLDTLKESEMGAGCQVTQCDLTETHLYLRAMLPTVSEVLGNDKVQAMILLQNSEVGAGRMSVALGMYRQLCSNGLWGDDIVSRVHLGIELQVGYIKWSEETLRDNDVLLFDQVGDTVKTALNPALWDGFVNKARIAAGEVKLEAPLVEIVDAIAPQYNITGDEKSKLLEAFAQEIATPAGKTQYGLANAVTRLARDTEDAERQVELEKIGGEILFADMSTAHPLTLITKAASV